MKDTGVRRPTTRLIPKYILLSKAWAKWPHSHLEKAHPHTFNVMQPRKPRKINQTESNTDLLLIHRLWPLQHGYTKKINK